MRSGIPRALQAERCKQSRACADLTGVPAWRGMESIIASPAAYHSWVGKGVKGGEGLVRGRGGDVEMVGH